MIYIQLFLSFFKIGLFGFGGGLAILSLIQHEVEQYGWMSQKEFVDIVAISQVTPGPIGMNCATYVGYTATDSILGSITASVAVVLPSLIIMFILCRLYFLMQKRYQNNVYYVNTLRGIRFLVLGLIGAAALSLMTKESFFDWTSWVIFGMVFVLGILPQLVSKNCVRTHKVVTWFSNPILLILMAGVAGYLLY